MMHRGVSAHVHDLSLQAVTRLVFVVSPTEPGHGIGPQSHGQDENAEGPTLLLT